MSRIILITGASSGLGKTTANYLAERGFTVYGTSRYCDIPDQPAPSGAVTMIPLDVMDSTSIETAIAYIIDRHSRIDVLVNNAGFGIAGSIEDTHPDEVDRLFDTNFIGVHRVTRAIMSSMREAGQGQIINIGSMGGEVAIPFQTFYSCSKAALALYSQGLGIELLPFNVRVTHIDPGDFRTGFTSARQFVKGDTAASIYHDRCRKAVAVMEKDEQNGAAPLLLAELIHNIIIGKARRPVYRVGLPSQRFLVGLIAWLPRRWVNRIMANIYGG